MSHFRKTQQDLDWPRGDDPAIREQLTQRGFRVLLTLAGAAAGLYVVLTGGQGVIFFGPFVGICGVYQLWHLVTRAARTNGATHADLVQHEPPAVHDADGYEWSD